MNDRPRESKPASMSAEEFRRAGHALVDWIAGYQSTIEKRPVLPAVKPGEIFDAMPPAPPQSAEPWDAIWRDVERLVVPGLVHWQSPMFFGYFPCNASYPAILGDMLATGMGVNGFLWANCPAMTEVEARTTDWMAELLGLPGKFTFAGSGGFARGTGGGVIQTTASEATLVAMVAARHRVMRETGGDSRRLVAYASSQAHSSVLKGALISGIGRENLRLIGVDESLAMRPELLEEQMRRDEAAGMLSFFVCATTGTTSTGALDPIRGIAEACRRAGTRGMWLHVDAAYAAAACVCPEFRVMLDGVELADSIVFNPHKALLVNFDCSCFWTADRASMIESMSVSPAYLRNAASASGQAVDYRDWQVPLGRRFRALKLWFVMRRYGSEGLREHVRNHDRLAALFESLMRADAGFELPTPRCFGLVCFRLRGDDAANRAIVERLNAGREILVTPTVVPIGPGGEDRVVLRLAVGATGVEERHIRRAWDLIMAAARAS